MDKMQERLRLSNISMGIPDTDGHAGCGIEEIKRGWKECGRSQKLNKTKAYGWRPITLPVWEGGLSVANHMYQSLATLSLDAYLVYFGNTVVHRTEINGHEGKLQ